MTTRDVLDQWLLADTAEAPYLVSAVRHEQLDEMTATLKARNDLEVFALPAEEATITIAMVRHLFGMLVATTLSHRRLVVIPRAERLSAPAAAALLKHLEEPSKTTRYLLTTMFPGRLLPTIVSRCQRTRLDPALSRPQAPGSDVQMLAAAWEERLRRQGPSAELRVAFRRLRDYYHIASLRGNEKLAKDVLVASSPPDEA